jgi:hypothetical protein
LVAFSSLSLLDSLRELPENLLKGLPERNSLLLGSDLR